MSEQTLQTAGEKHLRYEVQWPRLPLAVYREIAAHLRQVAGVETGLTPQQSQQFDYSQSQVGSLWIHYAENVDSADRQQVDRILAYYSNRYGALEVNRH
ncbi:hypothetical protein [Microcoleus sp. FACHB-672]|uniref:hypothetical protein n=1 Tax=Microcoleus sp. FACHB-672 TaxID=2692825 RepID=UPI00168765AF|nr:hypothetical protein [Microcoleus sp. FACHB-672]MBD2044007.1 hypothetical protein [Microcoleus sp. FACHB-672]